MSESMRWVGLDVHAAETTAAIFDQATGEVMTHRLRRRPVEVLDFLYEVELPFRAVYEAGPTGYGLYRAARAEGMGIAVCAPGATERRPEQRVKTDKRDAIRLARRLAAGELTLVSVPSIEHERLRDLVRCREDIRADLMRARHRLGKFLLRREIHYPHPGSRWNRRHRSWLAGLEWEDRASELAFADYLHAHDSLLARRDAIEGELVEVAESSAWAETIGRLRCLRGIDTLSALGLCAEVGSFERFGHPDQLASYLGLVPSEATSGEKRRQGSITKAGSAHARRLLVEASYHYRHQPAVGATLERRQRGRSPETIEVAWRAQRRLNARWRRLKGERGKRNGIVAIAVARELAGFCWEIAGSR